MAVEGGDPYESRGLRKTGTAERTDRGQGRSAAGQRLRPIGQFVAIAVVLGLLTVGAARVGATALSGANAWVWTELPRGPAPPASAGDLLAYFSTANRFVEFGGWNGPTLNETWALDPTNGTWTQLHPASSPPPRADAAFVYDSRNGLAYLFGGWFQYPNGTYIRYDDTWTFSLAADRWVELFPAVSPSARSDSAIAFDPTADTIVLVGGFSGSTYLGDEWTYSPARNSWSPFVPAGPVPSPRADGRMVFSSVNQSFLLFGGNDFSGPNFTFHHLNDTWVLSLPHGGWTEVTSHVTPPARDYAIQAFDPNQDWVLLTAGFGNRTILNDAWGFSLANDSWWPLQVPGAPPPRYAGVGGFDPVDGKLIVSGGAGNAGLLNDTWWFGPVANTSSTSSPGSFGPLEYIGAGALVGGVVLTVVVILSTRPPGRNAGAKPPRTGTGPR
jgi:galactose oxidase-like protein